MPATKAGDQLSLMLLRSEHAVSDDLQVRLRAGGLRVVDVQTIKNCWSQQRQQAMPADATLLDVRQADDSELDLLGGLLERLPLPVLFQDETPADAAWAQRLVAKIQDHATNQAGPLRPRRSVIAGDSRRVAPPLRCWVLGASFGGPQVLKRFLAAIAEPPPMTAFIIGQHIGDGFVDVLAAQLQRASSLTVAPADDGAELQAGRVLVAPVQQRMNIDSCGTIRLSPDTGSHFYMPSIDRLMATVAQRFAERSGAIVFSGMGDDGARGSIAIADAGGTVWAQDGQSSMIDSMPACARATGVVTRSGSPEQLAAALTAHLAAPAPAAHDRIA